VVPGPCRRDFDSAEVVVTYISSAQIMINLQQWFAENIMRPRHTEKLIWAREFRAWLEEQGCEIVPTPKTVLRNGFAVAPGRDRLMFRDEKIATLFMLRWS